jgi:hypothetical protein
MTKTTDTPPAKPRRRRRTRDGAPQTIVPPPPPPPAAAGQHQLTVAQAADQWEHADREIERLEAERDAAKPVLLDYFERTGRRSYKDRIALRQGADRTILDQGAVKTFLGDQLARFQKRVTPRPSLTRLHK